MVGSTEAVLWQRQGHRRGDRDDWVSESMFTITFNATWMGAGSLSRTVSSFHHSEHGLRVNGHSNSIQ